jgi:hypothetical protein
MTTRITVNIDSHLAERAFKYARAKKTSVDRIVEEQVAALLNTKDEDIAPAVKELAGILKSVKVKDVKKEYRKHILKKHKI